MHVTANGIGFHCQIDGPEGAPWLVFSNSLTTNVSVWDEQAAYFSRRFRVLRYDQRGHGQSDAPSGRYSFELLMADAVAIMDAVGKTVSALLRATEVTYCHSSAVPPERPGR